MVHMAQNYVVTLTFQGMAESLKLTGASCSYISCWFASCLVSVPSLFGGGEFAEESCCVADETEPDENEG